MSFSPLTKDVIISSAQQSRTYFRENLHEDERAHAFKYRRIFARKSSKLQHPVRPDAEPRENAGVTETIRSLNVQTIQKRNSWSDMVEEEIATGALEPLERCSSRLGQVSLEESAEKPETLKILSDTWSAPGLEEECAVDAEYLPKVDERMEQLTVPMSRTDLPYTLDNTAFPNFANVHFQSQIHDAHIQGLTVLEIAQALENDGYDAKFVCTNRYEYTLTRCIIEVIGMWDSRWGRFEEISSRGISLPVPESRYVQQLTSAKFNEWVQQQANTQVREIDEDSDTDEDEDEAAIEQQLAQATQALSSVTKVGYNRFNVLPQRSQSVLSDSENEDDGISPTAKEYDFSDEEYDSWEEGASDGGVSEDEETLMDQF